jgi:uncharacterized protein YprB with RNaseH-like and TPR domain
LLRSTFVHVPGVGYATERRLWTSGITTWEEFLSAGKAPHLGPHRTRQLEEGLTASLHHLAEGNHRFFRRRLPTREYWRAYEEFRDSTAFLDIETTGMDAERDEVTLIGLYDGDRMRHYMDEEMEEFPHDLQRYKLIVTFNGSSFDLPFLRAAFPGLRLHQIHVDLRYVLARLGLKGGLKAIERRVGIERTPRTREVRGWDAVYLWRRYQKGDEEALDILLEYNQEDVVNLKQLVEMAYDALRSDCLHHGFRTYSLRDVEDREDRNRYSHGDDS